MFLLFTTVFDTAENAVIFVLYLDNFLIQKSAIFEVNGSKMVADNKKGAMAKAITP